MNKKLKELINKATTVRYTGLGEIDEFDREKFAELIVRECAEVIDEKISPPSHPMNSIGYKLKEHFGVSE